MVDAIVVNFEQNRHIALASQLLNVNKCHTLLLFFLLTLNMLLQIVLMYIQLVCRQFSVKQVLYIVLLLLLLLLLYFSHGSRLVAVSKFHIVLVFLVFSLSRFDTMNVLFSFFFDEFGQISHFFKWLSCSSLLIVDLISQIVNYRYCWL